MWKRNTITQCMDDILYLYYISILLITRTSVRIKNNSIIKATAVWSINRGNEILIIFITSIRKRGKCDVQQLDTQCVENSAASGEWSVLTLVSHVPSAYSIMWAKVNIYVWVRAKNEEPRGLGIGSFCLSCHKRKKNNHISECNFTSTTRRTCIIRILNIYF